MKAASQVLSEPPLGYIALTVTGTASNTAIPGPAQFAVIETDAVIAYRVRPGASDLAAIAANDPNLAITANNRYVIDVSRGGNLSLITV